MIALGHSISRAGFCKAVLCALLLTAGLVQAGEWPDRPIKLIVPYPPGGLTDTVSRVLSDELATQLGQPIVVSNRAGAGGQVGLQALMLEPRDGYTVALVVPATMSTLPLTNPNFPFKPLTDFEPITVAVNTYLALVVSPKLGVKSVADFVAYGKKHPGDMGYGTPGVGTSFHFNNAALAQKLGIDVLHVPYKGEVGMLNDIAGGQLQYALVSNAGKPYIDGGKVIPLAVTTAQRVASLPDVPTFKEVGVDFTSDGWVGYVAAAGTPAPILDKLNAAFVKAIKTPRVQKLFIDMGYTPVGDSRADFRALIEESTKSYAALLKSGAVQLDKN
ncbi:MAG: tripartite tricarboxylate transporter substrate binding protein [Variovorax sp.]